MTRLIKYICAISFVAIIAGCNNDREVLGRLEQIKKAGDSNPREALKMLDSLTTQIKDESEYVRMKYDLLNLRLNDKAYIIPSSDSIARTVLEYFDKNGDNLEQQEANYYAASVYRDLKDAPRALEFFHKSEELAEIYSDCDSIMLKNTYSQLYSLMYSVQDYQRAYEYALKEYNIAKIINKIDVYTLNHLGLSYFCLDSLEKTEMWFGKELDSLSKMNDLSKYADNVYSLLYNYSLMKDKENSSACFELSKKINDEGFYTDRYIALGEYYLLQGKEDSAIMCYNYRITHDNSLTNKYDVSKSLFKIYNNKGDLNNAVRYASLYVEACDTLDLGRRQELAATINNQYQYHLDKNREMQLMADKEKSSTWLVAVSAGALLLLSSLVLLMMHRKNRHLKETVRLSGIAEAYKNDNDKLQEEIDNKIAEISKKEDDLTRSKADLSARSEELVKVQEELKAKDEELETNRSILTDKIEQNKSLFSLIHRAEFEKNAAEIVSKVQMSAEGMKNMTPSDWNELYAAIDTMYPDFKSILLDKLGIISRRDMMITYLIRIGLSNRQIMNMTNIPRTSLYRRIKDLQWIRTLDGSSIIHQSPHKHTASPKTPNPRKRSKKKVNK